MPMLAGPKKKAASSTSLNPRQSLWSKDENKLGQKMLENMGWSKGHGLGKNKQGMHEPLKVKENSDQKGMGYAENYDKNWEKHYDAFEDVLSNLNAENSSLNDEDNANDSVQSLELQSKQMKSRVHYKKFTQGKDLSRYNADDLACVLGSKRASRKSKEPDEEAAAATSKPTEVGAMDNSFGLVSIHGGSVRDYFTQKMAQLKRAREEGILGGGLTPKQNKEVVDPRTPLPDLEFEPAKTDFSFNISVEENQYLENDPKILENIVEKSNSLKKKKKKKSSKDDKNLDNEKEFDAQSVSCGVKDDHNSLQNLKKILKRSKRKVDDETSKENEEMPADTLPPPKKKKKKQSKLDIIPESIDEVCDSLYLPLTRSKKRKNENQNPGSESENPPTENESSKPQKIKNKKKSKNASETCLFDNDDDDNLPNAKYGHVDDIHNETSFPNLDESNEKEKRKRSKNSPKLSENENNNNIPDAKESMTVSNLDDEPPLLVEPKRKKREKRHQLNESYLTATSSKALKKSESSSTLKSHSGGLVKKMKKFASEINVGGDLIKPDLSDSESFNKENSDKTNNEMQNKDKKHKTKLSKKLSFKEITSDLGEKIKGKIKKPNKEKLKPIDEDPEESQSQTPKRAGSSLVSLQVKRKNASGQSIRENIEVDLDKLVPGSNLASIKGYHSFLK